ncbi:MAG TPA: hypothetical protein EYQ12_00240 [Oceanospirillaceae bacterium]|nr:hypothetical protein [Oceanospirillaceae bacterium]
MLMKFAYWLVASVLLLISACGGTVSTQPAADSSRNVTPYQTTEYYQSAALNLVSAADVYARAGTGQGITLAVMDSGINSSHTQLTGQVSASGYDYVTGQSGVAVDSTGHGTHIAGLMVARKDGQAMHGLAYDAIVLPIRVLDSAGTTAATTDTEMAAASALAMAQGSHIFNNSWGDSGTNILSPSITTHNVNGWHANFLVQARAAIAQDSVYVWAAGNQSATELTYHAGLPYLLSDLQAGWLAVTAVDNNGALASYANHCGVAAAWCLAAPGGGNAVASDGLYSTDVGGGHAYRAGTSMAAPQVSAAIAILKTQFPSLSYQQVAQRLLTTANKAGIYADLSIYGQGLIDLQAASGVVGSLSVPTVANVSDSSVAQSLAQPMYGLQVNAQLAALISPQLAQQDVLLLDSYQQAPFWASASQLVTATPVPPLMWPVQDRAYAQGLLDTNTEPQSLLKMSDSVRLETAALSVDYAIDERPQHNLINLHLGRVDQGWHSNYTRQLPNVISNKNPSFGLASALAPWSQQVQAGYAWPQVSAFIRWAQRDTMHRQIAGHGAFAQTQAQQQQWGLRWHRRWQGSHLAEQSDLSAQFGQSRLHTENQPNQLWHWRGDVVLNQFKGQWQSHYGAFGWGLSVTAAQAPNATQATLRWPNQIDTDGNIGYGNLIFSGRDLYNYQQITSFAQWHSTHGSELKLEAQHFNAANGDPLVGARLVWQGRW